MIEGEANQVARARAGDAAAFRGLAEAHTRPLFALCVRITRDAALAEDAVQEALYKAWRCLATFDGRSAFATWLHRIAVNAALEQLRRNARHRHTALDGGDNTDLQQTEQNSPPDEAAPGPEDFADGALIGRRIEAHMAELSALERAAFVLRHCEGESLEDIAATLSINIGQSKQAIFRAVRKLRDALEPMR